MANHIQQLLDIWHEQKDDLEWVLATVIATEGSSYRKPGAMMLLNNLGQYHGLLSGGCLESDIMRQSRQCWDSGNNRIIQYDMRDEEDIAWQLGIGCQGMVRILLQPINTSNDYLQLSKLRRLINQHKACAYTQTLHESLPANRVSEINDLESIDIGLKAEADNTFTHIIKPALRLGIFGGGIDAVPVLEIASNLGWQVSIADPRAGYARKTQFSNAKQIIKHNMGDSNGHAWLAYIDAIVIMTHNIQLDAQALLLAQNSSARYVGMLGPVHRTDRVLQEAGLAFSETTSLQKTATPRLRKALANPIGLRLGGELPESIALSILSEIHAFFEGTNAKSISNILE